MNTAGKVILKQGKDHSIRRKHPWVFSGAIQKTEGSPADGSWVSVEDHENKILGYGHFQKGSITVRILSFGEAVPQQDFYSQKIERALSLRLQLNLPGVHTDAYRLIHGEGDGLSGLIVDVYSGVAVIQAHSFGMAADRQLIAEALLRCHGAGVTTIYYKSQGTLADAGNEYLSGMGAVPHVIHENGNKFLVDWEEGQKTGFFLDQRESRQLLARYAENRKVLNTFCYTGGFSVYALRAGAQFVHSVDSSQKAIALTQKNLELNGFDNEKNGCYAEDTFDFLKGKANLYDLIVLDPPAFAKHKDSKHQAMKGYQRLNMEAMKAIQPGGIIFTFSCSQVVDRQLFYDTVVSSAIQTGRNIRVLDHLGQPGDHPVSIFHPEGEYLKGLVLHVE